MAPNYIRIHSGDNVGVIVNSGGLPAGIHFADGLELLQAVPQGHKVALEDIGKGSAVIRYNVVIGYALKDLPAGSWVNEEVLRMPDALSLDDLPRATVKPETPEPLTGYTFDGFRNPDGSVGTRNLLGITTTVQCVAGVVEHAAERIRRELLPDYPNVDGVVGLEHGYGCGVAIDAIDASIPITTLRNISFNPNFGGELLVVSLGCEKLQPERLIPKGSIPIGDLLSTPKDETTEAKLLDVVRLQDERHQSFASMIDSIMLSAQAHLERLNARKRETCPAAELVLGVQCGGSDAFSGLTANPAVGFCSDLLVRAGATVMFSEASEVRDGVDQLTARAASREVADEIIRQLAWYDDYLRKGGVDRSANTTPGNKRGGLSNIVEKAMGSIVKSGSSPISAVLPPGEKLVSRGLVFAATPASDFICGTLQAAAGMNMHVFTTGRGTPYNLAMVPVIKMSTNQALSRSWADLIDLDAGRIATGEASIEEIGWELFHLILESASGRTRTAAEKLGIYNDLVLFNPAPVT